MLQRRGITTAPKCSFSYTDPSLTALGWCEQSGYRAQNHSQHILKEQHISITNKVHTNISLKWRTFCSLIRKTGCKQHVTAGQWKIRALILQKAAEIVLKYIELVLLSWGVDPPALQSILSFDKAPHKMENICTTLSASTGLLTLKDTESKHWTQHTVSISRVTS